MKKQIIVIALLLSMSLAVSAQNNVGIGTNVPHASAKLEVFSKVSGFLPPRMNDSLMRAIVNPANGLIVFNLDTAAPMFYDSTASEWKKFGGSASATNGNQMIAGAVGLGGSLVRNTVIVQDTFDVMLSRTQELWGAKLTTLFINGSYKTPFALDTFVTNAHIAEITNESRKIFEISGIAWYSPSFDSAAMPMPIQAVYVEDTVTGRKELSITCFAEGVYMQSMVSDSGDLAHPNEASIFSLRGAHSFTSHLSENENAFFEIETSAAGGLSYSYGTSDDSIISQTRFPLIDGVPGAVLTTNGAGQTDWVKAQPVEEKIVFTTSDNDTIFFTDSLFDFSLSDTGASTHLVITPKVAAALGEWSLGEGTYLNITSIMPVTVREELNLMSSKTEFQMDRIDGSSPTYQISIHHLNPVRGGAPDKWVVLVKVIP